MLKKYLGEYFCHYLSDNDVDLFFVLSDLYVDLSDVYVDLMSHI